jgi:AcrR family transcriptional regulator
MATAPHTKSEVIRNFRVQAIVEAVYRVVARRGFKGTTVNLVAREAGIAKGTIYLYFRNKEEVIAAAIQALKENFDRELRTELDKYDDPREKLRRLVTGGIVMSHARRDFLKNMLVERNFLAASPKRPDARQILDWYLSALRLYEEVIAEGVAAGVFRPHDTKFSALALYEASRGLLELHSLGVLSGSPEDEADRLFDLCINGLVMNAAATRGKRGKRGVAQNGHEGKSPVRAGRSRRRG